MLLLMHHVFVAPHEFITPSDDFAPLVWIHHSIQKHGILCAIVLWKIWCARNLLIFECKQLKPPDIIAQSYGLLADVLSTYGLAVNNSRISSGFKLLGNVLLQDWYLSMLMAVLFIIQWWQGLVG